MIVGCICGSTYGVAVSGLEETDGMYYILSTFSIY